YTSTIQYMVDPFPQEPEIRRPKRVRTCAPEYHSEALEQSAGAVVDPDISPPASVDVGLGRSNNLANATLNLTDSKVSALLMIILWFFKCVETKHIVLAHFRGKKAEEGNSSWHILSFQANVPWCKAKYRIYRERDFKFTCRCGKFSHYEKKEMVDHLVSLDAGSQVVHKSMKEQKPSWQYK
ncbi:hypothetical protein BDR04DRAFT_1123843, partial [Suillus decipiens]